MKKLFLIAAIVMSALPCSARNYYVARSGNDSWPGTISEPWAHLQRADSVLVAGDTLFVRGGTYSNVQYISTRYANAGTPGHPIVVMAYPGEVPYFNSTEVVPWDPAGDLAKFSMRQPYWELNGLRARHGSGLGDMTLVCAIMGTNHVTIKNCSFSGTPSSYVTQTTDLYEVVHLENASYVVVDACSLQYAGQGNQNDSYVIMMRGSSNHNIIQNSVIRFGAHGAVSWYSTLDGCPSYTIVRNNVIDQSGTDAWGGGWGGGYAIDHIFMNNVACDSSMLYNLIEGNIMRSGASTYEAKCAVNWGGGCGCTFRKNLSWGNYFGGFTIDGYGGHRYCNKDFWYNNTIVRTGQQAFSMNRNRGVNPPLELALYGHTIANNVFYDARENPGTGWPSEMYLIGIQASDFGAPDAWWIDDQGMGRTVFKNNLFKEVNNGGDVNFVVWRAGNQEYYSGNTVAARYPKAFSNNLFSLSPRLADSTFMSCTLKSTSPCIDKGISMAKSDWVVQHIMSVWPEAGVDTLRWSGKAPDIGYAEFYTTPLGAPVTPRGRIGPARTP